MSRRAGKAMAEICGAVIGAGFASGREVTAFFTRYGMWGWLGVGAAGAVVGVMCLGLMRRGGESGMPPAWQGRWLEHMWRWMFAALLVSTAGAMVAAAGEVAALMLPVRFVRAFGMGATMLAAGLISQKEGIVLAWVSRGLILCLVGLMLAGMFLPAHKVISLGKAGGAEGIAMGLSYGGFNVALAAPVMAQWGERLARDERRRCALGVMLVLMALLGCGNAVLHRHTALMETQLPFVMLLSPLGKWGYAWAGAALYLAALTTLAACMRGLRSLARGWFPVFVLLMAVLSLGGLEGIVQVVYPALGGACLLLLTAAWGQKRTKM